MNAYRLLFVLLVTFISLTGCAGKKIFVVSEMEIPITFQETRRVSNFLVDYCVNNCEKKFNSEKSFSIKKKDVLNFCLKIKNPSKINYQIWVKYDIYLGKKKTAVLKKICFSNKEIATYKIYAPKNISGAKVNFQILIKSGNVLLFKLPPTNYVVKSQTQGDFAYDENL